jgi:hypothetical protein
VGGLNYERSVNEPKDQEQPERSRAGWLWGVVLVGAVIGLGLIAYFQRGGRPAPPPLTPEVETALKVADVMAKMAGRGGVNRPSPMALAELEPHLRVGMPFAEVRICAFLTSRIGLSGTGVLRQDTDDAKACKAGRRGGAMEGKYPPRVEGSMRNLFRSLSERDRRLYAAVEAAKLGRGGLAYLAKVFGCDEKTIRRGKRELARPPADAPPPGRSRQKGAGGII